MRCSGTTVDESKSVFRFLTDRHQERSSLGSVKERTELEAQATALINALMKRQAEPAIPTDSQAELGNPIVGIREKCGIFGLYFLFNWNPI